MENFLSVSVPVTAMLVFPLLSVPGDDGYQDETIKCRSDEETIKYNVRRKSVSPLGTQTTVSPFLSPPGDNLTGS